MISSSELGADPVLAALGRLPPVSTVDPLPELVRSGRRRTAVVLDDDPTGTQTVRNVEILTEWPMEALCEQLSSRVGMFFLLTNSRALPADEAVELAERTGRELLEASRQTGRPVSLISRSDSTLRGHFPSEVDALARGFARPDARIVLAPFFAPGGRITHGDRHYLRRSERYIPVAETEFASDPVFGYHSSDLRDFVREKAGAGRPVVSVALSDLRTVGSSAVAAALYELPPGGVCVLNAVAERDIEVAALGVHLVEDAGFPVVVRSAASYVRARAGQIVHPLVTAIEGLRGGPGLVIVGSHVATTTGQLEHLFAEPPAPLERIELDVADAIGPARTGLAAAIAQEASAALSRGRIPVLATSRRLYRGDDAAEDRAIAKALSETLVGAVRGMIGAPSWVLVKGGITSADVATKALGIRRANVLGQLAAGVPIWRPANGSRWRVPYVVFPGNVGDTTTLTRVVATLIQAQKAL